MSEWFKEHDWKSCDGGDSSGGSNPLLCAKRWAYEPRWNIGVRMLFLARLLRNMYYEITPPNLSFSVGYGSIVPRECQRPENCHRKHQTKKEWVEIGYFRFRLFLFYVSLVRNNFPLSRWLPQTDWENTVLLPSYAPPPVARKRQIQIQRCKDGNVGNKVLKRKVS